MIGFFPQIYIVKLDLFLVHVSKPSDYGVVVGTLDQVLVGPLIIFSIESSDRLTIFRIVRVMIVVISDSKARVIEPTFFDDGKELSFIKCFNDHLIHVIE